MIGAPRLVVGAIPVLAICLGAEWFWPVNQKMVAEVVVPAVSGPTPSELQSRTPADWANTILAQPLFTSNRLPPKLAVGTRYDKITDKARLCGIIIGRVERYALFVRPDDGKIFVLSKDGSVNGSTIKSIDLNEVLLADGTSLRPSFENHHKAPSSTPLTRAETGLRPSMGLNAALSNIWSEPASPQLRVPEPVQPPPQLLSGEANTGEPTLVKSTPALAPSGVKK
jgi:hypothetical protein